jgi:hypothetical protein
MPSSRGTPDFLRNSGSSVEIEVAPCVSCWFRSGSSHESSVATLPPSDLHSLLEEIDDLTFRIDGIQHTATKMATAMGLPAKEPKRKGRK